MSSSTSSSSDEGKGKRSAADQPAPEEARLNLRHPYDFTPFRPGDSVKHYAPGQGWKTSKVLAIAPGHGVRVRPTQGAELWVHDARNVLTTEEHRTLENHRSRFKALTERRAKAHREAAEGRLALERAAAAPAAPHPIDPT